MLEVTVKTLDGKNRTFCVPDDITVKEFKVKIANSIEIGADSQRLIFQGRVLQDEKKLNDYDVNGSVLHVVQRAPPSARGGAGSSTGSSSAHPPGYMQGSFSVNHEMREAGQNVVEQVLSGMGEMGRNAQVSARSSADGSAVEVHINLSHIAPPQVQSGSQLRINQARQMVKKANKTLHRLENPSESAQSSGRHSPMEAEATSDGPTDSEEATGSPTEGATANPPAAENSTEDTTESTQPQSDEGSANQAQNRGPTHPTSDVLSELLQQVIELNGRLEPHLDRYHRITSEDLNYEGDDDARRDAQRVQNLVSQALHYISHIYHHISDLMIDMNAQPPRQVRAPPTSIVQQAPTISPRLFRRNNGTSQPQGTRTTSSSTSSTTSSSTTGSSSTTTNTTPSSQAGPLPFGNIQLPAGVHIQAIPIPNMATNAGGTAPTGVPGAAGGIPLNIGGLPPFLQMLQGMRPPGPGTTTPGTSTPASATSTSNPNTSSSTSTTTSTSSQGGAGHDANVPPGQPPMGFMIPGPLPPGALPGIPAGMPAGFMAIPSLPGADPFLPCQSRHLIGQRAQARANQPGEQGQADSLGGMVNEIVQGIMRQQNPHLQPGHEPNTAGQPAGAPGQNMPNPFANLFSNITGGAGGNVRMGRPGQPRQQGSGQTAEPAFVSEFRNILQQGNQQTASRNTTSTSSTTSTTRKRSNSGTRICV